MKRPIRRRGRAARTAALATAAALVMAGCGTSGQSAGSSHQSAKIVGLWEIKGESSNAIDDYNNGAQLAISEINKHGGVLGQPVRFERVAFPVLDPQAARTAFLKAVDQDPSGIVGLPNGTVAEAFTRDIDSARTPTIHVSTDVKLAYGPSNGSEWLFAINANDRYRAANNVALAQTLGAHRIGLLSTDETFGREAVKDAKAAIKKAGLELGAVRLVSTKTTDLTEAILALKNSDAILVSAFPNVVALLRNQMLQNGISTPLISSNAGPIAVNNKLITGKALENFYAVTACAPDLEQRPSATRFATAYRTKYGKNPSASATNAHDAVLVMAHAIRKASSSTDRDKIREALASMTVEDGACVERYQADGAHFLTHHQVALKYSPDGSAQIVKTYTIPPTEEGKA